MFSKIQFDFARGRWCRLDPTVIALHSGFARVFTHSEWLMVLLTLLKGYFPKAVSPVFTASPIGPYSL